MLARATDRGGSDVAVAAISHAASAGYDFSRVRVLARDFGIAPLTPQSAGRLPVEAPETSSVRVARLVFGPHIPVPVRWDLLIDRITVVTSAPSARPLAPPGGAAQIEQHAGSRTLGYTVLPAAAPPNFEIEAPVRQSTGRWKARVRPSDLPPQAFDSFYPAPGVHDRAASPTGQRRHVLYTDRVSNLIRDGEQEHCYDIAWAHYLVNGRAARAINEVAAREPPEGGSPAEASQRARAAVRDNLPPQLRWPDETADPLPLWRQVYGRVVGVTNRRDDEGWHSLSGHFVLMPAEKQRVGVPPADELVEYDPGGQIGVHDPETLGRDRFNALAGGGGAAPAGP
jgi:hypothetical protein